MAAPNEAALQLKDKRWRQMMEALAAMRVAENGDVILVCQNKHFYAHKWVLESSSVYFTTLFNSEVDVLNDGQVVFHDIEPETMDAILDFVYLGDVLKIQTEDQFRKVMEASHMLQLEQLFQYCCDALGEKLSISSFFGTAEIARKYSKADLKDKVNAFWLKSGFKLVVTRQFLNLSVEDIKEFITVTRNKQSCLDVMIRGMLSWLCYDLKAREAFAEELFACLDPALVSKDCVRSLLKDEIVMSASDEVAEKIKELAEKVDVETPSALVANESAFNSKPIESDWHYGSDSNSSAPMKSVSVPVDSRVTSNPVDYVFPTQPIEPVIVVSEKPIQSRVTSKFIDYTPNVKSVKSSNIITVRSTEDLTSRQGYGLTVKPIASEPAVRAIPIKVNNLDVPALPTDYNIPIRRVNSESNVGQFESNANPTVSYRITTPLKDPAGRTVVVNDESVTLRKSKNRGYDYLANLPMPSSLATKLTYFSRYRVVDIDDPSNTGIRMSRTEEVKCVQQFDLSTMSWLPLQIPQLGPTGYLWSYIPMCQYGRYIFMIGARDNWGVHGTYDVQSGTFEPTPSPRFCKGMATKMCFFKDHIYAIGGYRDNELTKSVYYAEPGNDCWEELQPLNYPQISPKLLATSNYMYVVGDIPQVKDEFLIEFNPNPGNNEEWQFVRKSRKGLAPSRCFIFDNSLHALYFGEPEPQLMKFDHRTNAMEIVGPFRFPEGLMDTVELSNFQNPSSPYVFFSLREDYFSIPTYLWEPETGKWTKIPSPTGKCNIPNHHSVRMVYSVATLA